MLVSFNTNELSLDRENRRAPVSVIAFVFVRHDHDFPKTVLRWSELESFAKLQRFRESPINSRAPHISCLVKVRRPFGIFISQFLLGWVSFFLFVKVGFCESSKRHFWQFLFPLFQCRTKNKSRWIIASCIPSEGWKTPPNFQSKLGSRLLWLVKWR